MSVIESRARESGRVAIFKSLVAQLQTVNLRNDAEFHAVLVESQMLLELSDLQIADGLLVSRPTVNRWMRGRNLPHVGMRRSILSWFVAESVSRMKMLGVLTRSLDSRFASVVSETPNLNAKERG